MTTRTHARAKARKPTASAARGSKSRPAARTKAGPRMPVSSAAVAKRPAKPRAKPPASQARTAAGNRKAPSRSKPAERGRSTSRPAGPARPRSAGPRSRPNARRLPIAIAAVIALVIVGTSFPAA
ncbi:MAG TPA: hypothetical protein VG412_05425, partial [Acidimicrobiales bacterium]|nr:hypothetical protein [Acidimicrobiales bacterium]